MFQFGSSIVLIKATATHNFWVNELQNLLLSKHNFGVCELRNSVPTKISVVKVVTSSFFFFFYSIDFSKSFILFCLLNIEANFELWQPVNFGALKYEKPGCIKTSRNRNKSKSWKQFKNDFILKWRSQSKRYDFSQKLLIRIYSKECNSLARKNWRCKRNQIKWIASNFSFFVNSNF